MKQTKRYITSGVLDYNKNVSMFIPHGYGNIVIRNRFGEFIEAERYTVLGYKNYLAVRKVRKDQMKQLRRLKIISKFWMIVPIWFIRTMKKYGNES